MNKINYGRTAIITGGGQGIGKCIAKSFLEQGINVVIAELDAEAGKETENEYSKLGSIKFVKCDAAKEDQVRKTIKEAIKYFGSLNILINNCMAKWTNKPLDKLTLKEWNRVIGVNLTGTFLFAKSSAPYLKKNGGMIINLASTRALMSEPDTEPYSASKGGIVALTHSLAISLGPKIRVNCISPGWIATDAWQKKSRRKPPQLSEIDNSQHPAGRVGTPEDIANMVSFLVKPENSFITGANFVVDGGMTRKMIYS